MSTRYLQDGTPRRFTDEILIAALESLAGLCIGDQFEFEAQLMNEAAAVIRDYQEQRNALLIGSAPELLRLLEKAVDRQGFSNNELIAARAALAKAKGETQ